MAGMTGGRRIPLLFSVLAGLFLMHGISAVGPGGCHGMSPSMAPMRVSMATAPMQPSSMARATPEASTAFSSPAPMSDRAVAGETCIPLRPEGLSGLFLALFLIVIALCWPWLPRIAQSIRCYWANGPPRTGVQILRTLSISRT